MRTDLAAACRFDHVIVGAVDVDAGARYLERATGLDVQRSGSHPGRGTHNATAPLAGGTYLESLAPDPAQPAGELDQTLRSCDPPRLLAWVVRCEDVGAAAAAVTEVTGTAPVVEEGSRDTANGQQYRWRFGIPDEQWPGASVLPGLVQWDGAHPTDGHTSAVSWVGLRVKTPDHEVVAEVCRRLSLDVVVEPAPTNRLVALLDRDGREVHLT